MSSRTLTPIGGGLTNPMTTLGDLIVAATGGTPARKAVGSDNTFLRALAAATNGIKWDTLAASDIPNLAASIITSGILGAARGGTGIDASAATDGQLLIGQSSDHSLGLATLTAGTGINVTNSGHGITIATSGSGGGGTALTQIAKTSLGSSAASITFSSISGSYSSLQLMLDGRVDGSSANGLIQFNSDTGSNYDGNFLDGRSAGAVDVEQTPASTSIRIGTVAGTDWVANVSTSFQIFLLNYAATTFQKTMHWWEAVKSGTAGGAGNYQTWIGNGWWRSTAAITSIKLFPASGNFVAGTTAILYGVS